MLSSESEIKQIEKIAKLKKKKIQIGVRLNPNTDAKTLSQISTGRRKINLELITKLLLKL